MPVSLHYHNIKPEELDKIGCLKSQNDFAIEFNKQLKDRVIKLREELPDAVLTYVDMYAAKYELIANAKQEGNHIKGRNPILSQLFIDDLWNP